MDETAKVQMAAWQVLWEIRQHLLTLDDLQDRQFMLDKAIEIANQKYPESQGLASIVREFVKDLMV